MGLRVVRVRFTVGQHCRSRYAQAAPCGFRGGNVTPYAAQLDRRLTVLRQRRGRTPTRARVSFATAEEKASYIDGAAREDARLPAIKSLAGIVTNLPPSRRADELYDFVRRSIDYLLDPDGEEFEDAQTALVAGQDDCDGSARAFAALCIAAGLDACVRAIISPDGRRVEHFQGMVRWPGSTAHPMALPGGGVDFGGHHVGRRRTRPGC